MRAVALVVVLAGCRSILGIDDGKPRVDAPAADDGPSVTDSAVDARGACFGTLVPVCITTPPTAMVTFSTSVEINTDSDPRCQAATNGLDACVIAATTLQITATVTVQGSRPIVFLASGGIMVTGVIDAASHAQRVGPAANDTACTLGTLPIGTGGGAGGSFGTGGASGGGGGVAGAAQSPGMRLRGGCAGQTGPGTSGGAGGAGGGALALIATTISIGGTINASGAGGRGGAVPGGGAGGGGSGGMIVLDAPGITTQGAAKIFATGGGGGEGGGPNNGGNPGADPSGTTAAAGGAGGPMLGGDGGSGYGLNTPATAGAPGGTGGGGGGGGGGAGVIRSTAPVSCAPPPS